MLWSIFLDFFKLMIFFKKHAETQKPEKKYIVKEYIYIFFFQMKNLFHNINFAIFKDHNAF